MALTRNFIAETSLPNQIELTWDQPLKFNDVNWEIIVTRTSSHYPSELFNTDFPTKATDSRPVEIFRGRTIAGTNTGTISVIGNTLTDTSATFPTSPSLKGRLLRDSTGEVFRIVSNTVTTVTLEDSPINGKYVILADFPTIVRNQQNFEIDVRTSVSAGSITNLVELINGSLQIATFSSDELVNLIFKDGAGTRFIVKDNTETTINFYESSTPVIGSGMSLLPNFTNTAPKPYIDTFLNDLQASNRTGTGLLNNQFYYYTSFSIPVGVNVAQVEFSTADSGISTQSAAISTTDRNFGELLFKTYWPTLYQQLDTTGDLEDVMKVFGFQFNEIHSLIDTYRLQDPDRVYISALQPLSEQFGLPTVGFSIGIDTLRRIAKDMISAWKLKGSKEGIALFIRIITTWDITDGTADFSTAIQDFLPNASALRFFDVSLGSTNTRLTSTSPFVAGGRFARSLPGIVIPGFFTFREFVVTIPNVALFVGDSTSYLVSSGTTTMTDTAANFGANDSLIGNFLLPNQDEINDMFLIIGNTSTSITVQGIINNRVIGGNYAVLSPLNTNRFKILNKLLPFYIPFKTIAGFVFT